MLRAKDVNRFLNNHLPPHQKQNTIGKVKTDLQDIDFITFVDNSGKTLLHHAIANSFITMYLINRGCKIDAVDYGGDSPLMLSIKRWLEPTVRLLLEHDADILKCNQHGKTPLEIVLTGQGFRDKVITKMFIDALKKKFSDDSFEMMKILLDVRCPISRAMLFEDVEITKYMLDHGYSVHDRDVNNDTALHYAVSSMHLDNVRLLIERGADVNAVNAFDETPLHLYDCQREGNQEILRFLLERDASLMVNGGVVAGKFLSCGNVEVVKILLEYELDFRKINDDGETLLHHVAKNKNRDVFELIQGTNFDVDTVNSGGKFAFWYAIEDSNPAALEFLLRNGSGKKISNFQEIATLVLYFSYRNNLSNEEFQNFSECLRLLLLYGVTVEIDRQNMFIDCVLNSHRFILAQPFVEQIAIAKTKSENICEFITATIESYDELKNYFHNCMCDIEVMRNVVVYEKLTMYDLLTASMSRLEKFARNGELVENFNSNICNMKDLTSNLIDFLQHRFQKGLLIANLRQEAATYFYKTNELFENVDIVNYFVLFLDHKDLVKLV